jgi:cell division ATPase FtsA
VQELATDDKISFPHARKGTVKSIRRKNLAKIIEERLMEIAEWVRKEIKEAGCGSRFAPIVLLTGGGAEMSYIETLFSRELKVDEVRSVFPEYGLTDNMGEHITSRAHATIASLLLYGAKHGMCAVAVRTQSPAQHQSNQPNHSTQPQQTYSDVYSRNVAESSFAQSGNTAAPRPVAPRPATPKPEGPEVTTGTLGTVDPEQTTDPDTIDLGNGDKGGKGKNFFTKITEWFTGKDDEYIL